MKFSILLLTATCMLCGQREPQQLPPPPRLPAVQAPGDFRPSPEGPQTHEPQRRGGLRVAVDVKSDFRGFHAAATEQAIKQFINEIKDELTTELRRLGDVQVTSETPDEILHVFVGGEVITDPHALRAKNREKDHFVVFVLHTRPDGNREAFISGNGPGEPPQDGWAEFVRSFDSKVLEDDRRRLFK